jgi:outer membrane usher protein
VRWWPGTDALTSIVPLAALLIALAAPAQAAVSADPQPEELLLSVEINDYAVGDTVFVLRDAGGRIWIDRRDAERWRMPPPAAAPQVVRGNSYLPLAEFAGVSYRVDETTQTLYIRAKASAFARSTFSALETAPVTPTPSSTGGFLNYDLSVLREPGQANLGALLGLNVFGAAGTGVTRFAEQRSNGRLRSTRLESTWTRDFPTRALSLRIGDGITGSSVAWGSAVRFGGIQLASNFATQPGFVTFAVPAMQAEAVLPSVIDLYVNNALRLRRDVPMGPFELRDLPVVNGNGDIRLVVRDVLGREVEFFQPYFTSPELLRKGLNMYSYEVGAIREFYGFRSNQYGQAIVSGTHRRGLSNSLTGELHAAATRDVQELGATLVMRVPVLGIVATSVAGSRSAGASGRLVAASFERQARHLSVGAALQMTSEGFADPGVTPMQHLKLSSQFYVNLSAGRFGSVGVTDTQRRYYDSGPVELLGLRYSQTIGSFGLLGISVQRARAERRDTLFSMIFTMPLDMRRSASLSTDSVPGGTSVTAHVQRNLPAGEGLGYRVESRFGYLPYNEAGIGYRTKLGSYDLTGNVTDNKLRVQGGATGAVAWLGGHAFASREIGDSFAIVDVPDNAGVRIYDDNQEMGRSDKHGLLLLPSLRAYENNRISIEQADLPLDVSIDTLTLDAVPYARSGLLVRFPVQRPHGALLTIRFDDGAPMPAGSRLRVAGTEQWFPFGTRGEVYVTGLGDHNRLEVEGAGQTCYVTFDYPKDAGPLPRLGPFVCQGTAP